MARSARPAGSVTEPPAPEPPALEPSARVAVLAWFDAVGRALAFRASRDPYAILVSEVMAQQTQIGRVVEAWSRFVERFPTVEALAGSSPADVLRAWQGMGYDRRALNLRRAARAIVEEHGGRVPSDVGALERLPGIGPYTARAVASIAFGARVGAVDTNVRRVLGRVLGGAAGPAMAGSWLQAAADGAVDPDRPADWTHAVMDVGATLCRPMNPRCEACPFSAWCRYAAELSAERAAGRPAPESPSLGNRPRAGGSGPSARRPLLPRPPRPPFPTTNRWLRGRIVDRLRAADGSAWTTLDPPIGDHDAAAIGSALTGLARDGVVELGAGTLEARLATS